MEPVTTQEATPGTIGTTPGRDDGMIAITVLVDARALVRALTGSLQDAIRSGQIRSSREVEFRVPVRDGALQAAAADGAPAERAHAVDRVTA